MGPAVTPAQVPAVETPSCSLCLPCRTTRATDPSQALVRSCQVAETPRARVSLGVTVPAPATATGTPARPGKAARLRGSSNAESRDRKALPTQVKIPALEEHRRFWWQHYTHKAQKIPQREDAQHLQHLLVDHCSDFLPPPTTAKTFRSSQTLNTHHNPWIIY